MLVIVKVQGGEENERKVAHMLEGLPNLAGGEPTRIVILPWFTEFTELPRDLIEKTVKSLTKYLAETK